MLLPFLRPSEQAAKPSGAINSKFEIMAISSKDIETLWKRYSSEAVNRGVSVAQFLNQMVYLITYLRNGTFRVP